MCVCVCVCPATVVLVRNTAWDVIGQEPSLHSSVHSNFFFPLCERKYRRLLWVHFIISETLSPGDNRC